MKHIWSRYFLGMLIFSASCTTSKELNYRLTTEKHSPESLKHDLSVIHEALKEAHPGLYWYTSKANLDSTFEAAASSFTKPMTSLQFYRVAAPVVSGIRDGHTRLIFPGIRKSEKQKNDEKKKGTAPLDQFRFKLVDNHLFITRNLSLDSTIKNGDEVTGIDGKPVQKIISNLKTMFSSDGFNQTFMNAYTEKQLPGLFKTYYNKWDSIKLTINERDHLINYYKKVTDQGLTDKKLANNKKIEKEKQRYRGFDENGQPLLDLSFVKESPNIAILRVRSFSFPGDDHARFFKEAFRQIREQKVEHLVLDLRNNPGGKLSACKALFSFLIDKKLSFLSDLEVKDKWYPARKYFDNKLILDIQNVFLIKKSEVGYRARLKGVKPVSPDKLHYDGKLYVLINGYSFSASTLLAANLQGIKRAIFIGEESGGGYNRCTAGIIPLVTLPESRVKLRLPLIKIAPAVTRELEGRGIFPDYPVKPSLDDLIAGKDAELDFTLGLIASEKTFKN